MWIALSIIGLYVWLLKRRKKTTKQHVSKLLILFLFVATAGIGKAQSEGVIISGEIITTTKSKGKIIAFLVDETAFKTPLAGIDTVVFNLVDNVVHFKFEPTEKGVYGIRCFHDINSNKFITIKMED